jgi:Secretion system C-terminal sorting domain
MISDMRQKKVKLGAVLLLGLGITALHAQVAIPASGGNATGSGGSVSYTVGQVVYTSTSSTTGSIGQGAQQPYKISLVTGLEGTEGITLQYSAYPNPTIDYVTLRVDDFSVIGMTYQLSDLNGKQLENKKVKAIETAIDMSDFSPAVYLLKVMDTNKELKTFKIIKIN